MQRRQFVHMAPALMIRSAASAAGQESSLDSAVRRLETLGAGLALRARRPGWERSTLEINKAAIKFMWSAVVSSGAAGIGSADGCRDGGLSAGLALIGALHGAIEPSSIAV